MARKSKVAARRKRAYRPRYHVRTGNRRVDRLFDDEASDGSIRRNAADDIADREAPFAPTLTQLQKLQKTKDRVDRVADKKLARAIERANKRKPDTPKQKKLWQPDLIDNGWEKDELLSTLEAEHEDAYQFMQKSHNDEVWSVYKKTPLEGKLALLQQLENAVRQTAAMAKRALETAVAINAKGERNMTSVDVLAFCYLLADKSAKKSIVKDIWCFRDKKSMAQIRKIDGFDRYFKKANKLAPRRRQRLVEPPSHESEPVPQKGPRLSQLAVEFEIHDVWIASGGKLGWGTHYRTSECLEFRRKTRAMANEEHLIELQKSLPQPTYNEGDMEGEAEFP